MNTLAPPRFPYTLPLLPMRSLTLSYLLAALGFLGVSGVHRFYLGKPRDRATLVFTGGLFMVGTIYDLITMESQVGEANRNALAAGPKALRGAAPYGYGTGHAPRPPAEADFKDPRIDLELRVLKLARKQGESSPLPSLRLNWLFRSLKPTQSWASSRPKATPTQTSQRRRRRLRFPRAASLAGCRKSRVGSERCQHRPGRGA